MPGDWFSRTEVVQAIVRRMRQWAAVLCAPDRRRLGRHKSGETAGSDVGRVLDISQGGMRVFSRRPLCGTFDVTLWSTNRWITLEAEVVWTKRLGFRSHVSGLRFIDLDAITVRSLATLWIQSLGNRTGVCWSQARPTPEV